MSVSREFVSKISIVTLVRWATCIVLPSFILFGVFGYALLDWPGVILALFLSIFPFALVLFGATRVRVRVLCDDQGLHLHYDTIAKHILWSDIRAVYRTHSILWRNLIRIEGTNTTVILNMNIQPNWRELIEVLSSQVPENRLQNFRWAEFAV